MKRHALASLLVIIIGNQASAAIIARWTFETSVPTTAGPHAAEVGAGSATGFHAGATTYSNPAGNGSTESFSSDGWAIGDYYQFAYSGAGLTSQVLSFDHASSNTGPGDFRIETTLDGSTYTTWLNYSVLANAAPNPVWNMTTSSSIYSFSFALPNNIVGLRLVDRSTVSANGGTVGAAGTSRVDNVTISAVPEPASLLSFSCAIAGFAGAAIRRRGPARR